MGEAQTACVRDQRGKSDLPVRKRLLPASVSLSSRPQATASREVVARWLCSGNECPGGATRLAQPTFMQRLGGRHLIELWIHAYKLGVYGLG